MKRRWLSIQRAFLLSSLAILALAAGTARANDTLMRFPTLHGDSVVFEAHGNLWEVRAGGTARRLTTDPGYDLMPRYSPDGKWIAFTGQYQGNTDVYVIPGRRRRCPAPHFPLRRGGRARRNAGDRTTWCWAGRRTRRKWCSCRAAAP